MIILLTLEDKIQKQKFNPNAKLSLPPEVRGFTLFEPFQQKYDTTCHKRIHV